MSRRFQSLLARLYFRTIRTYGADDVPKEGAVLFACVHRNGAVDGLVMGATLDGALGIAGKNLSGSAYLRLFLGDHVAVYRHPATPAENKENLRQLKRAAQMATQGRRVVMFPEGTSKLGPRLLPVKGGMAHLARLTLKEGQGMPVHVVPVGLHYSRGFEFRSDVEVTFGRAMRIGEEDVRDLDALTERITRGMEAVAVLFADAEEQRRGELFADMVCGLDDTCSHREACRAYAARDIPPDVLASVESAIGDTDRHALPPVVPPAGLVPWVLRFLLLTPMVCLFFAANLLPLLGGYCAGRIMADDDNVVTLWRILAGVPLWGVQMAIYLGLAICFPPWAAILFFGYALFSWGGVAVFQRWKRLLAGTMNRIKGRGEMIRQANDRVREWRQCKA